MSKSEIELLETNETFVEYEDKTEDEVDDSSAGQCGVILVSNQAKFIFACMFCDKRYEGANYFINHFRKNHVNTDQVVECLDATDVSDQDAVLHDDSDILNSNDDAENSIIESNKAETDFLSGFREFVNKTFYEKDTNQVTKRKTGDELNQPIICQLCDGLFHTKEGYEKHKERHNFDEFENENNANDSDPPYEPVLKRKRASLKCQFCKKQFVDTCGLEEHERIHTGEKPFKCDVCTKCFSTKRQLGYHSLTHSGERPHQCPYCPSAFTHIMNLKVHIKCHLGDKRFKCEICGKRFVRNVERRIHIRTHTGEKPYQCESCGHKFYTCGELTEHLKRHTNTRPYQCETCNKSFYSTKLLKNHMVVHSNERPYTCDFCASSFPRKKALQSHLKLHSETKQYVCAICGKAFAQNAGLYCHMKSHGIRKTKNTSKNLDVI